MMTCPTIPASGKHASHCRAALACLLRGGKVDQFNYHNATGNPLVDYRTRISNLRLTYEWPIASEFHYTNDFNGEPRRVKQYWLDRKALADLFRENPEFDQRCALLVAEHFGGEA